RQREADAKFRALLEAAPHAMVIVDPRGPIVFVNAQTEPLFGHPAAARIGRPAALHAPARRRPAASAFRTAYTAGPGPGRTIPSGQQLLGLRRDGAEFPAEISLSPLASTDGTLVFIAVRDVTERNRADQ